MCTVPLLWPMVADVRAFARRTDLPTAMQAAKSMTNAATAQQAAPSKRLCVSEIIVVCVCCFLGASAALGLWTGLRSVGALLPLKREKPQPLPRSRTEFENWSSEPRHALRSGKSKKKTQPKLPGRLCTFSRVELQPSNTQCQLWPCRAH